MRPRSVTVTLELELADGSVSGRLLGPDGVIAFAGWLGLTAALERALEDEGLPRAPPDDPE